MMYPLYTKCAPSVHRMYTGCTVYTQCTSIVHPIYTQCTSNVHWVYSVHPLYTQFTPSVHPLYTGCTVYTHWTPNLHPVYIQCTPNVHSPNEARMHCWTEPLLCKTRLYNKIKKQLNYKMELQYIYSDETDWFIQLEKYLKRTLNIYNIMLVFQHSAYFRK